MDTDTWIFERKSLQMLCLQRIACASKTRTRSTGFFFLFFFSTKASSTELSKTVNETLYLPLDHWNTPDLESCTSSHPSPVSKLLCDSTAHSAKVYPCLSDPLHQVIPSWWEAREMSAHSLDFDGICEEPQRIHRKCFSMELCVETSGLLYETTTAPRHLLSSRHCIPSWQ